MDFANPHFAEPQWLWLAFLLPAAALSLFVYARHARLGQLAQFAARVEPYCAANPW